MSAKIVVSAMQEKSHQLPTSESDEVPVLAGFLPDGSLLTLPTSFYPGIQESLDTTSSSSVYPASAEVRAHYQAIQLGTYFPTIRIESQEEAKPGVDNGSHISADSHPLSSIMRDYAGPKTAQVSQMGLEIPAVNEPTFNKRISKRNKIVGSLLLLLAIKAYTAESANAMFHVVSEDMQHASEWSDLAQTTKPDNANRPEYIILNNQLEDPAIKWAQRISTGWFEDQDSGVAHRHTVEEMVEQVAASLQGGTRYVMFDEAKVSTVDNLKEFAVRMVRKYPQFNGRWGVFLVDGQDVSYANLNEPSNPETSKIPEEFHSYRLLDVLLDAGAPLASEFYVKSNAFFRDIPLKARIKIPGTSRTKDVVIPFSKLTPSQKQLAKNLWLADDIGGNSLVNRPTYNDRYKYNWLVQKAVGRRSTSPLPIVLGVTDRFLGGATAQIDMLDRQAYAVRHYTRSGRYTVAKYPFSTWKHKGESSVGGSLDNFIVRLNDHYHYGNRTTNIRPFPREFVVPTTPSPIRILRQNQLQERQANYYSYTANR